MTAVELTRPVGQPAYVSKVPFDEERVGAAAVYCSDGRFGEQMDEFLHKALGLPRYDRVAMPGGAACLAENTTATFEQAALERQLEFLIREHQLRRIVLIAHEGCGFYKNQWTSGNLGRAAAATGPVPGGRSHSAVECRAVGGNVLRPEDPWAGAVRAVAERGGSGAAAQYLMWAGRDPAAERPGKAAGDVGRRLWLGRAKH